MPRIKNALPATRSEAMRAFCHDCMGLYEDGMVDCGCQACPLYQWMPYRKKKPVFVWATINSKRIGRHPKDNPNKTISNEEYRELINAETARLEAEAPIKRRKTKAS